MFILFLKALLAGLVISAPAGPTGILCIRRTLLKKDKSGFFTGYGAATADLFYAIIAGFGITVVSEFVVTRQDWFQLIGGLVLLIIGIYGLNLSKEAHDKHIQKKKHLLKDYASGLLVALSNPATILTFFAAYAIIGIKPNHEIMDSVVLVVGSFIGSLIGWTTVNSIVALYRNKINENMLHRMNKIFGTILILFGVFLLADLTGIF